MGMEVGTKKLGNRLTCRPCKGDEIDFKVSAVQTQDVGICAICEKRLLIWTHSFQLACV